MAFPTYSDDVLVAGEENVHSFLAKEDVQQGQAVEFDTDDAGLSVEPVDADGTASTAGVALYTASSGEQVAVATPTAIVRAVSDTGSISAGQFVTATNSTNEGEFKGATSGDRILGVALKADTGSNAEGTVIIQLAHGQFGD